MTYEERYIEQDNRVTVPKAIDPLADRSISEYLKFANLGVEKTTDMSEEDMRYWEKITGKKYPRKENMKKEYENEVFS
jgi:hypothetical protein